MYSTQLGYLAKATLAQAFTELESIFDWADLQVLASQLDSFVALIYAHEVYLNNWSRSLALMQYQVNYLVCTKYTKFYVRAIRIRLYTEEDSGDVQDC